MIDSQQITATLMQPFLRPVTGTWYRAVKVPHIATALQYSHTVSRLSRFSAGTPAKPAHALLYLAENHEVALHEAQMQFGAPGSGLVVPNPFVAPVLLNISVQLNAVVDLTIPQAQLVLETTVQELTGDWFGYSLRGMPYASVTAPVGEAPTQTLGAALYRIPHLQGLLTLSGKMANRRNLVVFPDRVGLHPQNFLEFTDPATGLHRIP